MVKQVAPLKYSKILNISQYNHRLSITIIIFNPWFSSIWKINFKNAIIKLNLLNGFKLVTGLSIPMTILRLNFITTIIFIHLSKPMISMIFLHITLITSLSTVDLTPNFSESNYIYPYHKWYKLCKHWQVCCSENHYPDFW